MHISTAMCIFLLPDCRGNPRQWPSNKIASWLPPQTWTDGPLALTGCLPAAPRKRLSKAEVVECPINKNVLVQMSTPRALADRALKAEGRPRSRRRGQINQNRAQGSADLCGLLDATLSPLETNTRFLALCGRSGKRSQGNSLTTYSKTRVRVSLVWMMSWSSTMLACFRPFRRDAVGTEKGDG